MLKNSIDTGNSLLISLLKEVLNDYIEIKDISQKHIEYININLDEYDHENIPDNIFIQDQRNNIKEFNNQITFINNNIETNLKNIINIVQSSNSLNSSESDIIKSKSYCRYQGHCNDCTNSNTKDQVTYCIECYTCKIFRDREEKRKKEEAIKIYDTYINPKTINPNVQSTNKIINQTINNTINNTYISSNKVEINIHENYFVSTDLIFSVIIEVNRNNVNDIIKELKYIFTFLMCGSNGKSIFPDEPKHSTAATFPVSAALYTIKNEDTKPILYGLLKYKKGTASIMTIKKLENINKSNVISKRPIVKASLLTYWENKKNHYCTKSLKDTINNITDTSYYGSDINDFCK